MSGDGDARSASEVRVMYPAAIAIVVVVVIVLAFAFRRRDTGYKVDEFARARSLTTEWARRAEQQNQPRVDVPAADTDRTE